MSKKILEALKNEAEKYPDNYNEKQIMILILALTATNEVNDLALFRTKESILLTLNKVFPNIDKDLIEDVGEYLYTTYRGHFEGTKRRRNLKVCTNPNKKRMSVPMDNMYEEISRKNKEALIKIAKRF